MVNDPNAPGGDPHVCATSGPIAAVRLRFTASEQNIGDGPLLVFDPREPGDGLMPPSVRDGQPRPLPRSYAQAQLPGPELLYYDASHHHWHYRLRAFLPTKRR
jgi:hypothetical protein